MPARLGQDVFGAQIDMALHWAIGGTTAYNLVSGGSPVHVTLLSAMPAEPETDEIFVIFAEQPLRFQVNNTASAFPDLASFANEPYLAALQYLPIIARWPNRTHLHAIISGATNGALFVMRAAAG